MCITSYVYPEIKGKRLSGKVLKRPGQLFIELQFFALILRIRWVTIQYY